MYSNDQEAFTRIQSIPKAGPAPEPEAPSTTAGGLWRAVRNAVPAAVAESAAMVAKGASIAFDDSLDNRGPVRQFGEEVERSLRNVAESYGPDPMTASKAEQVVFGLTRGVGKAVGYGLTTGPAAPFLFGADEGLTEREKLLRQGVDEATATKVGALAGAVNVAGFAIPAAGATVAKTLGLATLSGPASFVAQQAGSREILRNADYESIASSYDPTDALGLGLSAIPFGFGAWAMRGRFKSAKPAPESAPVAPDAIPVEPVRAADELAASPDIAPATPDVAARSPDVVARAEVAPVVAEPVVKQEHVDAAMVKNLTDFADGVKANPPEKFEAELWRGAVTENPNFKSWFGESKILDESGRPLIVYHGSPVRDFDSFDIQKINPNDPDGPYNGFFFSSSRDDAETAGLSPWGRPQARDAQTRAFYISLKNPATNELAHQVGMEISSNWKTLHPTARTLQDATRLELQNRGYDGVIQEPYSIPSRDEFENSGEVLIGKGEQKLKLDEDTGAIDLYDSSGGHVTSYEDWDEAIEDLRHGVFAVFNPSSIKSATDNSGRFDPNSPSLTDPTPPKETPADVPTPEKLGTETREAPAPEGKAEVGKAAEGAADAAAVAVYKSEAERILETNPDMVVDVDAQGNKVTAREALEKIRREAAEGTATELGADDAKLVKVAAECALSFGE